MQFKPRHHDERLSTLHSSDRKGSECRLGRRLAEFSRMHAMPSIDEGMSTDLHMDPLTCVQELRDPARISAIKKRLRQEDVDEEWMSVFLQEGGLQAVWDVMEACGRHEPPMITAQLKCVECIKAVITRPTALDYMIRAEERYIHRLVMGEYILAI